MTNRSLFAGFRVASASLLLLCSLAVASEKPNVVFILVDDLGWMNPLLSWRGPGTSPSFSSYLSTPGVSPAGSTCGVPVTSTDLYPTILGLAGLPAMPSQHSDGVDLAPLLKGKKMLGRKAIYWHYPHYHGSTWAPGGAIRAGDWKPIEFFEEEKHELYRLGNDLGEREDLSRRYPEKAKELLDMLHRWREDIGAKMPERNADFSGA